MKELISSEKTEKVSVHRLNCYVENKPGVLARIVGLISGRGYNIHTLNVGPTDDGSVSRMHIDVIGSKRVVSQIILQLRNCVNVIEVVSSRLPRRKNKIRN
jgi:acetolactate synthase-1/3 small subunit